MKIRYILFDAANTLIWKPDLFTRYQAALTGLGYDIGLDRLRQNHKLISEVIRFPDRTSEQFYNSFNAEVLLSLGILPGEEVLRAVFDACTYLKWDKYEDSSALEELDLPMGILSNFNSTLSGQIQKLFGDRFRDIIISENLGVAKPSPEFFQAAIRSIGLPPEEVLYIGDSLKLDVIPAMECGMQVRLIDRDGWFPGFGQRIRSFAEIKTIFNPEP